MLLGPLLAVVFAGITGGNANVDKQVKQVVRDLHIKPASVSASGVRALAHHSSATKQLVRKLHADGVIACEVSKQMLRLVVYDGTGGLKTFIEIPVGSRGLSADDLDVLKSNLESDAESLGGSDGPRTSGSGLRPEPRTDAPAPQREPAVTPKPAPAEIEMEGDESPLPEARSPQPEAAGDSVSAADIEALTAAAAGVPAASSTDSLHLGADVGFGLSSRNFAPGPATVAAYVSSPVGAIHLAAHVQPTERFTLAVGGEHTLTMATALHDGMATTTMSRWEATASYAVPLGSVRITPQIGFGRRAFSIDSTDPSRSPDGDYNYAIIGATAAMSVGSHLALLGSAAFEPVLFGVEPTEMAFGEASRWAIDVGAAVEWRHSHVFARVAADYQRFALSFDMAGARGAGGAVDAYPSGMLSLGADY